jgi:hypothetical protein
MAEKENIIEKMHDLLLYTLPQLSKFPRDQKFILADRIEGHLLDVLELLITAYYSTREEKTAHLKRVNLELEKLRHLIRLSSRLKCLSIKSYGVISEKVNEIGVMVGAWMKAVK